MQPQPAKPLDRSEHIIRINVIAVFLLVFSLEHFERDEMRWRARWYEVKAERVKIGVPFAWLIWNRVSSEGSPPPFLAMPDSERARPGLSLRLGALGLAVLSALALAIVIHFSWRRLSPRYRSYLRRQVSAAFVIIPVIAVGVGIALPPRPLWIGAVLVAGVLPITVLAVTWRRGTYGSVVLGVAAGVASAFWGARVGDYFRAEYLFRDVTFSDEVLGFLVYFGVFVVPLLGIVAVRKFLAKLRIRGQ